MNPGLPLPSWGGGGGRRGGGGTSVGVPMRRAAPSLSAWCHRGGGSAVSPCTVPNQFRARCTCLCFGVENTQKSTPVPLDVIHTLHIQVLPTRNFKSPNKEMQSPNPAAELLASFGFSFLSPFLKPSTPIQKKKF